MGEQEQKVTGGCLCGAIRYEASGPPVYVPYCYCKSCRRATGAPVIVRVVFAKEKVKFTRGERKVFKSSPGVERAFCATCGTPLTWEGTWGGVTRIEVYISTLDDPEAFVPDRHAFLDHGISWFHVEHDLPRYGGSSTKIELG